AAGHRLAIIVNEFGELGIDRELLLRCGDAACRDEDIVELANGCLCCTVADDFLPTLSRLIDRAAPPDHIVIETSGLALPKPLVQAFAWPEIRTRTTVDGVLTVIDAAAFAAGLFASDPDAVARQRGAGPSTEHDDPRAAVSPAPPGRGDSRARHPAGQGLPRRARPRPAPSRASGRCSRRAAFRSGLGAGRAPRDAARRYRQKGPRPRRDRCGARRSIGRIAGG